MESTICPADLSTIKFELTHIEAKIARRFKRVALVIPLAYTREELRQQRTLSVQNYVLRTFSEAVALWPILSGSITRSGKKSEKLNIQAPVPSVPARRRSDLVDIENTLSDPIQACTLLLKDINENLNAFFFPADRTLDASVPPLLMKLTFVDNLLVLGFSFFEVVADNAFIGLFLSSMVDPSWNLLRRIGSYYSSRTPLVPIRCSPDRFPFYDRSDEPIAQLTPSNKLVSQVVEFQEHAVSGFIRNLRSYHLHCGNNRLDNVKDKDVITAILWAAITKARYLLGKVQPLDKVRMNILLPGGPCEGGNGQESYFGNSTVPTVATASALGVIDLGDDAAMYRNSYFQPHISDCGYGIKWISQAAFQIHIAIRMVDAEYVRRVMGAKRRLSVEEDSAAYERGIDRSTTGTTFEDWTDFYRHGRKTTGIPFTDTRQFIRVLPCADDLEEGKIILLSHFRAPDTGHCQTRRLACLCLETETMKLVREQLEAQGWIKKGVYGMTDMTTPPE